MATGLLDDIDLERYEELIQFFQSDLICTSNCRMNGSLPPEDSESYKAMKRLLQLLFSAALMHSLERNLLYNGTKIWEEAICKRFSSSLLASNSKTPLLVSNIDFFRDLVDFEEDSEVLKYFQFDPQLLQHNFAVAQSLWLQDFALSRTVNKPCLHFLFSEDNGINAAIDSFRQEQYHSAVALWIKNSTLMKQLDDCQLDALVNSNLKTSEILAGLYAESDVADFVKLIRTQFLVNLYRYIHRSLQSDLRHMYYFLTSVLDPLKLFRNSFEAIVLGHSQSLAVTLEKAVTDPSISLPVTEDVSDVYGRLILDSAKFAVETLGANMFRLQFVIMTQKLAEAQLSLPPSKSALRRRRKAAAKAEDNRVLPAASLVILPSGISSLDVSGASDSSLPPILDSVIRGFNGIDLSLTEMDFSDLPDLDDASDTDSDEE